MKRKRILVLLALVALVGGVVWRANPGRPRIEFVEFRDGDGGREAVFRIVNPSRNWYDCHQDRWSGYLLANFFYEVDGTILDVETTSALVRSKRADGLLAPRTSGTISAYIPTKWGTKPFRFGINVTECDEEGVPLSVDSRVRAAADWIRFQLGKGAKENEITLSEPVRDSGALVGK